MPPKPVPGVAAIQPYKGGESVLAGFEKPVKLASNENPLGASPKARAAYLAAAEKLALYPEDSALALRTAIGRRHGLDPQRILCGAGSDEIFQLLGRAYLAEGDEIVESEHAFAVYRMVAQAAGAGVARAKDKAYVVDVDAMLAAVSARTKIVFLANPNNPTGTYTPYDELVRLHAGLPEHVLLVIDAAYAEYVQRNDYAEGLELASAYDNVIMTRTFSKIHGLAGLRVGWAYGAPGVIAALNAVRGPFNVSAPAMAAAAAALEDGPFVEASIVHNARELKRVSAGLAALGLHVTPSVCNFVLVHFPPEGPHTAPAADAFLRSRGFILRRMETYSLPGALRMSIGAEADNTGALAALADFLR